jgi:hypothetical protein
MRKNSRVNFEEMLISSKFLSGLALPTLRSDLMRWDLCGGRRSRGRAARPTLRQLIAMLFCSSHQVGRENEEGLQSPLHVTRAAYTPHHERYIPHMDYVRMPGGYFWR